MVDLMKSQLVPAAVQGDFTQLSQAIYDYGYAAGMAFVAEQGGPFNGRRVTQLVEYCRSQGVRGVGQSSWGPTVFSLHQDREHADAFASHLREELGAEVVIAKTQNRGAKITRTESAS